MTIEQRIEQKRADIESMTQADVILWEKQKEGERVYHHDFLNPWADNSNKLRQAKQELAILEQVQQQLIEEVKL